jgi:hypothetical protein
MKVILPNTYEDNRFYGLSTKNKSVDLEPGFVTQCDNFNVEAGSLVSRPGKQGAWTAALSNPIYALTPVTQTDGTTRIWCTSGGNLYSTDPSTGTRTQITYSGMPSLDSPNVTITHAAGYVYVADNQRHLIPGGDPGNPVYSGLFRFNPDGTGGGLFGGMVKPDAPGRVEDTNVQLTSNHFIPGNASVGSLSWTVPTATDENILVDPSERDFPLGSTFWEVIAGGRFGDVTSEYNGRTCAEFDGAGDGVKFADPVTITATSGNYPQLFFLEAEYSPQDPGPGNTNYEATEITMTIYENNDWTGMKEERSKIVRVKMDSTDQGIRRHIFDFRGGAVPEPQSVDIKWVQLQ